MALKQDIPSLKYGNKVSPDEIAGMLGLPYVGKIIYVDPNDGDDSRSGSSLGTAKKTVSDAFDDTTSGKHDVVLIVPTGGTGRTAETGVITWNKRFTHLVGSAAPVAINTRAGMSAPSGLSAGESFLDITENGCIFANLTLAAFEDVDELVEVTGNRNAFINVHFAGLGNATAANTAAGSSLHLTGGQENLFSHCTFGLDTVARGAANFGVEFESAASRNVFEDCRFIMYADADTPFHVKLEGTNAIDRWVEFKNCSFYTFWADNADDITAAFETSEQSATAHILLTGNTFLEGATDWEASASGILRFNNYDSTGATATMGITLTNT